jgi:hypothetical protein
VRWPAALLLIVVATAGCTHRHGRTAPKVVDAVQITVRNCGGPALSDTGDERPCEADEKERANDILGTAWYVVPDVDVCQGIAPHRKPQFETVVPGIGIGEALGRLRRSRDVTSAVPLRYVILHCPAGIS